MLNSCTSILLLNRYLEICCLPVSLLLFIVCWYWCYNRQIGYYHNTLFQACWATLDCCWNAQSFPLQPLKLGKMAGGKKLPSYIYYLMAVWRQKFQCMFFVVSIIKSHKQMLKCFLQMIFIDVSLTNEWKKTTTLNLFIENVLKKLF